MSIPTIVWFTGLPSSGKTSLALRVRERLLAHGQVPIVLDSDRMRALLVAGGGYDDEERTTFYGALSDLAVMLASQGHVVLIAATGHRREFRERARLGGSRFIEVLLDVDEAEARRRDVVKGVWKLDPERGSVPGRDQEYEAPLAPDVRAKGADDDAAIGEIVAMIERPRREQFEEVYIALRLAPEDRVLRAHRVCCEQLGLVPRGELHLTLAYLGQIDVRQVEKLGEALSTSIVVESIPSAIVLEGFGGAVRAEGRPVEPTISALRRTDVRKVVWWAASGAEELRRLRTKVVAVARTFGHEFGEEFWPHVTVGSNAPSMIDATFDVHDIEKHAAWGERLQVSVDCLHITDTVRNPESLFVVGIPGRTEKPRCPPVA